MSTTFPTLLAHCRKNSIPGATLTALLLSSSAALADNCNTTQTGGIVGIEKLAVAAGSASAALAGTIGNINTAFLNQQGSAFVSAPANAQPDQPGGGVWGRAVGGEADLKSSSASMALTKNASGAVINVATTSCANSQHQSFEGVQLGADIARLNWSGWNVHFGTTAGYLGSKETDNNGFNNTFQVPFFGTYLAATHGRFFADLMVREEFYNISANNPALNFSNQPIGAHGYSISASGGYNFDLGQGVFIEPSAGFVYSKTSVDNFVNPSPSNLNIPGVISTNDIESEIGRLSVRAGKTIETPNVIWQPFFTASVFHEFAGNVLTNYSSLPNAAFLAADGVRTPVNISEQTSTSRVGTYGQYSLGVAAQLVNTGWLGFVRVDYRNGENIEGWAGNAGVRYQFTPEAIASVMPTKAVKAPRAPIGPTNWTGFYAGGFAGAAAGRTDIEFVGTPFPDAGNKPSVLGGLGGIELGYNQQFSNSWVLGVEGDIATGNVHGGRTAGTADGVNANGVAGDFSPAFFTVEDRTNWTATVAGRAGYSWGRTLFYGKGGVAIEDSSTTVECDFRPGQSSLKCRNQERVVTNGFSTPSYTRVGWTIGFGTEFDLGKNWSAKAEYDFLSFGRHTALASDGTTFLTDRSDISQVKLGVNYRFAPGAVGPKF
jgi:opacity protein-like surface antigen